MLVMGVPFACYMAVRSKRLWERWVGIASLIVIPFGVLLTSSRNGIMGLALSILTLPLLLRRSRASIKMLIALVIVVAGFFAIQLVPSQTWERLGTTLEEFSRGTLNGRGEIWSYGLLAFPKHLWVGVGAGGWQAGTGNFYTPHNTYLEMLVEEGMVGFTLYLLILGTVLRGAVCSEYDHRPVSGMMLACFLLCTSAIQWGSMTATWFVFGYIIAQGAASKNADFGAAPGELSRLVPVKFGSTLGCR
jgi:O-antigen ligase